MGLSQDAGSHAHADLINPDQTAFAPETCRVRASVSMTVEMNGTSV